MQVLATVIKNSANPNFKDVLHFARVLRCPGTCGCSAVAILQGLRGYYRGLYKWEHGNKSIIAAFQKQQMDHQIGTLKEPNGGSSHPPGKRVNNFAAGAETSNEPIACPKIIERHNHHRGA
jgi:hypothetical protein